MRYPRLGILLIASAGYVIVGTATAALAAMASSPTGVKGWRLAAWLLSLVIFSAHLAGERRREVRRVSVATSVAVAVALGAFVLAALGPFRSHLNDSSRLKLALLSLAAWPLLTGVPAFAVALFASFVLDRISFGGSSAPSVPRGER